MNKYSSYKDSGVEWIGEIPKHWILKGLRFSFKINKGKIPKTLFDKRGDNMLPYLSMDVLRNNPPKEFSNQDDGLFVKKGEIGILWDGSNSGEIVSINQDGILSSTVSRLGISDSKLNKQFSYYILKFYEKDFKENTIGMGIPHMDGNHLKFSKIILPPLPEQQQIVSFLDDKTQKIDSLIQQKEKKIELLKEKRTSLINHVVTKGLDPNVEMKDSGVEWIGDIPSHWDFVKVGHYSNVVRGGSPRPSGDPRFFNGDFIHWITVKDITSKKGKYVTDTLSKLTKEGMKQSRVLEPETLVLTNSGVTLGVPGILKIQGCINDGSVGFLDLSEKLERDYLYYFWTTQTELLLEQQSGYGQPNLNIDIVSNVKFPLPSKNKQQQIVEYLDKQTEEIDTLIQLEQKKIDTLKEYRQSLISEVVTGKIRVCEEDNSLSLYSQTV